MTATDQSLLLRALVDELARAGMREAVTAPGSRNSPIIQALVNDPRLRAFSQIDERCAGFFALGAAKASGRPVAVTVTSGTAVANLLPAVIEAREAGVPLIVISADRPAELRDVGAGQTIDQVKIYGSAPKWFSELDVYEAGAERMRWVRSLACRAYFTALAGRPGPVHLNVPLREPLLPEQPLPADPEGAGGRAGGAPWVTIAGEQPPQTLEAPASKRPLLVAGEGAGASVSRLGIPVLADPLSGARSGASAIAYYDLILRSPKARAELRPDAIYRVGGLPTSKPLRNWLAELQEVPQIQLASGGAWIDPAATVRARHDGLPAGIGASPEWLDSWRVADIKVGHAVTTVLGDQLSEPAVARLLGETLPSEATLYVAASMPIRDVEEFFPVRDEPPRVIANRGANGIDGTVSAAFGAAAVSEGPVVLLIGDVALAHDIGGLLAASRSKLDLTIVLLNNDGGGIFDFLAINRQPDVVREHVSTSHGLDFSHAAALYGIEHAAVTAQTQLTAAVARGIGNSGSKIIEVHTERATNRALHAAVESAALDAIATGPGA